MKISKIQLAGIIATQYRAIDALTEEMKELIEMLNDRPGTPGNSHEKKLAGMLGRLEEMTRTSEVILKADDRRY